MDMWPLYKVSGMSRDSVVRTRYFHYVYDLSSCLHVKIARRVGRGRALACTVRHILRLATLATPRTFQ